MKKKRNRNGIYNDLDKALSENAVAQIRFASLSKEEQAAFRARAEETAHGLEENKRLADDLVGWQKGHPPYQL